VGERLLGNYGRRCDTMSVLFGRPVRRRRGSASRGCGSRRFRVIVDRDDQTIAILAAVRGTAPGSGAFEIAFGAVDVIERGRFVRIELFDRDAETALLRRFHEFSLEHSAARLAETAPPSPAKSTA
jgi:hypothetical protein